MVQKNLRSHLEDLCFADDICLLSHTRTDMTKLLRCALSTGNEQSNIKDGGVDPDVTIRIQRKHGKLLEIFELCLFVLLYDFETWHQIQSR